METIITVAAIVVMIAGGMFLIHRLNTQHDERIAAFRYGDAPQGSGRQNRTSRQPTEPIDPPVAIRYERHAEGPRMAPTVF
ncbi:hypothetical protein [Streptomyces scopuliridis]|uniref:Uncharacterized protein n=1 Tax=Streptomyces scopuliridis RB72 TaxID=1440053 RepID=A0A2T7SNY3_9ACTN|nr:hypothetical protein [Streptomyces scopuliridis]PVE04559.1 hypothetical protein Y717_11190 [Streptomyces scopuliridis RB72]